MPLFGESKKTKAKREAMYAKTREVQLKNRVHTAEKFLDDLWGRKHIVKLMFDTGMEKKMRAFIKEAEDILPNYKSLSKDEREEISKYLHSQFDFEEFAQFLDTEKFIARAGHNKLHLDLYKPQRKTLVEEASRDANVDPAYFTQIRAHDGWSLVGDTRSFPKDIKFDDSRLTSLKVADKKFLVKLEKLETSDKYFESHPEKTNMVKQHLACKDYDRKERIKKFKELCAFPFFKESCLEIVAHRKKLCPYMEKMLAEGKAATIKKKKEDGATRAAAAEKAAAAAKAAANNREKAKEIVDLMDKLNLSAFTDEILKKGVTQAKDLMLLSEESLVSDLKMNSIRAKILRGEAGQANTTTHANKGEAIKNLMEKLNMSQFTAAILELGVLRKKDLVHLSEDTLVKDVKMNVIQAKIIMREAEVSLAAAATRAPAATPGAAATPASAGKGPPYHCFLTHCWGKDETGRDNHERVSGFNDKLNALGYVTWFDGDRMTGQVQQKMTSGIDQSMVIIVFITKNYMKKTNAAGNDNCKLEFGYASNRKGAPMMLPVVMEKCMENTKEWTGPLGLNLGQELYTWSCEGENIDGLVKELANRGVDPLIPPKV